jgi:hypothetical protein
MRGGSRRPKANPRLRNRKKRLDPGGARSGHYFNVRLDAAEKDHRRLVLFIMLIAGKRREIG